MPLIFIDLQKDRSSVDIFSLKLVSYGTESTEHTKNVHSFLIPTYCTLTKHSVCIIAWKMRNIKFLNRMIPLLPNTSKRLDFISCLQGHTTEKMLPSTHTNFNVKFNTTEFQFKQII